jgi:hypothetical protein
MEVLGKEAAAGEADREVLGVDQGVVGEREVSQTGVAAHDDGRTGVERETRPRAAIVLEELQAGRRALDPCGAEDQDSLP